MRCVQPGHDPFGQEGRHAEIPEQQLHDQWRVAKYQYLRIAGARGHQQVVGTPESIADQLQQWFEEEGADGFNIMSPWLPGGLTEFAELVVPELQRRGLFRTEYEGATLRENLGLPRPENRYAQAIRKRAAS